MRHNPIFKKIVAPFYYLLVDRNSFDRNTPILTQLAYSMRFRLAGAGIFLNENERKLASFKDIHKGKRCFIIGNGPSLNKLDLKKLKNEYTFGVNAIYLNYEKMQFHPTYYVLEDNLVAEDRGAEIKKYTGPQYKFFGANLNYAVAPDHKTINMNVIRTYSDVDSFDPQFSEKIVRFLGVGGSVTYLCLQLAYYMGFEKVYMIGFDHSYKIPEEAIISNKHEAGFDILSTTADPNHFSPDYFGKGYRWHDPNVERMEMGFRKANEVFERNGRKVYNATAGGNLNAFDRINYDDLF
ncbi:6-hydroxymethylpterin diphosphokinase MptE-like protein [Larkinella rosea]|uniref:DUF115 domain-containing protein n=1 Tax=Larkinella rosea TaxID=2025312 RepID=A0A3P1BSY1_9BACT|nr:6-hydroxymethylpterin diphosphokinase MptE-like protein [Larkinella rosea]RRB04225.1 DUF115 domain-containing protein [Larkinella rosea]